MVSLKFNRQGHLELSENYIIYKISSTIIAKIKLATEFRTL